MYVCICYLRLMFKHRFALLNIIVFICLFLFGAGDGLQLRMSVPSASANSAVSHFAVLASIVYYVIVYYRTL